MNPAAQLRRIVAEMRAPPIDGGVSARIDAEATLLEIADHLDTRHDLIDDTDGGVRVRELLPLTPAERIREIEDQLPTDCVTLGQQLLEVADDLDATAKTGARGRRPAAQLRSIADCLWQELYKEGDSGHSLKGQRDHALSLREIADHLDARHDLIDDTDAFYAKQFPDMPELTYDRLLWRRNFIAEELHELEGALGDLDAVGVVDALIDLIVVALGTLKEAGVDIRQAWTIVHEANMAKVRGSQPSKRAGSLGFDLVKPAGWVAPDHSDNVGTLAEALGR